MKIISWNVNGIRAVLGHDFAGSLAKMNPDIIGLQEVKIDDARRAQSAFEFAGYQDYWHSAQKPGYSGTAILTKTKPLRIITGLDLPHFDDEGRVITAEYDKFFLINAYFPNAQPELVRIKYKSAFNKDILEFAQRLEKSKPVIICGDFNVALEEIDLARPKENVGSPGFSDEERRGGREFLQAGFIDTFRYLHPDQVKYSWWSYRMGARAKNVGWRIDYFMISQGLKSKLISAEILNEVQGSDHCPVSINLKI
jgi:exodeoxyribonuclease-3